MDPIPSCEINVVVPVLDKRGPIVERCTRVHRLLRCRRNFEKATALSTGVGKSKGGTVITVDGDPQDDPNERPQRVTAIEKSGVSSHAGKGTGRILQGNVGLQNYLTCVRHA